MKQNNMPKITFFRPKKQYLPQISRLFTEHLFFWAIFGVFSGVLASFLAWNPVSAKDALPGISLTQLSSNKDVTELTRSYDEWKRVVEEKPEYRDGYVMLAWYAKELGKTDEVLRYLQKIGSLDPNYSVPEMLQIER